MKNAAVGMKRHLMIDKLTEEEQETWDTLATPPPKINESVTMSALYSYMKEQWKSEEACELDPKDFSVIMDWGTKVVKINKN